MGALDDLIGQVEDEPIPGGCNRCDAYQRLEQVAPGVNVLTVVHDDWCPFLRSRDAVSN